MSSKQHVGHCDKPCDSADVASRERKKIDDQKEYSGRYRWAKWRFFCLLENIGNVAKI